MKTRLLAFIASLTCFVLQGHAQAPHPLVDLTFQPVDNVQGEEYGPAVVQPDGRILMGTRMWTVRPNADGVLESVRIDETRRLNSDGSLDTSFLPIPGHGPTVVAPNGDIIVAAEQITFPVPALLNRADRHGRMLWSVAYGLGPGIGNAYGVALQADGKILVYGYGGLKRYRSTGEVDGGFAPPEFPLNEVWSAAALRDGKILVAFSFDQSGTTKTMLVRLHPDGAEDETFFPWVGEYGAGLSLAVLADGKILVGGGGNPDKGTPGLVRLHADGTPDGSFHAPWYSADTMVVQPDGKIVIGGDFLGGPIDGRANPALLTRLLPDGSHDAGFGCPLCDYDNEDGQGVHDLTIGPDGNVIATGSFFVPGTSLYGVVRLKTAPPVPVVQFAMATQNVKESTGAATIKVIRTGNTLVTSSAAFVSIGLTAKPWRDFLPRVGVLVFRSGESEKSFQVKVLSDDRSEGTETVAVILFAPSPNTRIGGLRTSVLQILDSGP